jgi:phosphate transport system protein
MHEHTVAAFDNDLQNLAKRLVEMGGLAEAAVADSVAALVRRDAAQAQAVIAGDKRIDALQRAVEESTILIIARRQPLANDLRAVVGAIRIASDLERIGDLAKNIAKRVVAMNGVAVPPKFVSGVDHLSRLSLEALKDVLDAYARNDAAKALGVWKRDGAIDAMHTSIFRELLTYMLEDPRNITACIHLLFSAKNMERVGDHATNIAETIYYVATGEVLADDRPKSDEVLEPTPSAAGGA